MLLLSHCLSPQGLQFNILFLTLHKLEVQNLPKNIWQKCHCPLNILHTKNMLQILPNLTHEYSPNLMYFVPLCVYVWSKTPVNYVCFLNIVPLSREYPPPPPPPQIQEPKVKRGLFLQNIKHFELVFHTINTINALLFVFFLELSEIEPNVFLRPFLEVVRSEDTTGPITGLALTSVNKFLVYGLISKSH